MTIPETIEMSILDAYDRAHSDPWHASGRGGALQRHREDTVYSFTGQFLPCSM